MKFSVIIPIFNAEKFIDRTIQSLMDQTFHNFELILVNDGSSDKTSEICHYYERIDQRIFVIDQVNQGQTAARKVGLKKANGDFVCFIDADDFVELDYLECFAKELSKSDYDIICMGYTSETNHKKIQNKLSCPPGPYSKKDIEKKVFPSLIQDDIGSYFLPTLWAKAIKLELALKYVTKVDNNIKMGEDRAVIIPIIINCDSLFISDKCYYHYLYNESSLTNSKARINLGESYKLVNYIYQEVQQSDYDFMSQIYRWIVHLIFNYAHSVIMADGLNMKTIKDICGLLDDSILKEVICKSHFKRFTTIYTLQSMIKLYYLFK